MQRNADSCLMCTTLMEVTKQDRKHHKVVWRRCTLLRAGGLGRIGQGSALCTSWLFTAWSWTRSQHCIWYGHPVFWHWRFLFLLPSIRTRECIGGSETAQPVRLGYVCTCLSVTLKLSRMICLSQVKLSRMICLSQVKMICLSQVKRMTD